MLIDLIVSRLLKNKKNKKTMSFRWVYATPDNENITEQLQNELGVPEVIAHLLALRKVDSYNKAKQFFRGDLTHLHNPFLMADMQKAALRVAAAIRDGEHILVYGDYDVDGTTATSILYLFLKKFGVEVSYYVPHRFDEGYGLNAEAIKKAAAQHTDLLISVDCGITAIEEAEVARRLGIDLIICDHHNVGNQLPAAEAVLNPKRPDCNYPFDGLSGAGVTFKLIQAVTETLGLSKNLPFEFLDLVAISTASDIVPIVDENRILMREGLIRINREPRVGLKALFDIVGMQPGFIGTSNIVFSIGPRINAAGRMGDAEQAVQLLIAENPEEAKAQAHKLEAVNHERRKADKQATDEATTIISESYNLSTTNAIILYKESWHLGVVGIVASRLVDAYHRPAILLSNVDGMLKGSARSIEGFNIYNAISECSEWLEEFGGHAFAAGLSLKPEKLEPFRQHLNEVVANSLAKQEKTPQLKVDYSLDLCDINKRLWKLLSQFRPFGPKNLKPVFISENINVVGIPTIVGKGHLKMKLQQPGSGIFDSIGFNMHEYLPQVRNSGENNMKIAFNLEENYWNGKKSLQLKLLDIQFRQ